MPAAALDKLATQLRTNYKRTVSEFLELQVRGSAASDKVLAELHASLFSHGEAHPKALVAGLGTLKSSDLRSMLGMIRAPALVIAGQYDRVTLPAASRALADALPDARYVEFRRAAHAPFLSHTAEFASLITRFLQGAPIEETNGSERNRAIDARPAPADASVDALVAERILTGGKSTDASLRAVSDGPVPEQSAASEGLTPRPAAEQSRAASSAIRASKTLAGAGPRKRSSGKSG
jgi:hypothetical protein